MKYKKFFVVFIVILGLLINVLVALSRIYISLPAVIATSILGTAIVGAFLGPIAGAMIGGIFSATWMYVDSGLSYRMILALIPMMEGFVAGTVFSNRVFRNIAIRIMVLSFIIPIWGYFVSAICFGGFERVMSASFINELAKCYTSHFSNKFMNNFLSYGISCSMAGVLAYKLKGRILKDEV